MSGSHFKVWTIYHSKNKYMQVILFIILIAASVAVIYGLWLARNLYDAGTDCEHCYLKEQCNKHSKETGKTLCNDYD